MLFFVFLSTWSTGLVWCNECVCHILASVSEYASASAVGDVLLPIPFERMMLPGFSSWHANLCCFRAATALFVSRPETFTAELIPKISANKQFNAHTDMGMSGKSASSCVI